MLKFYPNKVKCSCHHHNTGGPFLPYHSPKVTNCGFCWALSDYVGFRLNQTLKSKYKCIYITKISKSCTYVHKMSSKCTENV